ncbi:MAG TPA: fimbria/pilus periplasmic chaperone [Candidatus Rubrimentiphilum sp.]|nr:fimbria/pilus periplasmic chaperone [Candidatus Rubrimentiphilum sp.]
MKAATFSVDPIIITLEKTNSSASIAVTNQTTQKLRLQVTGFSWSQSRSGQVELAKTDQLVYFPQLLSLDPGETKRVRVGVTMPQGPTEKTYRVFMEELPSLQSVLGPKGRAQVTLLLKVGVPVFLRPAGSPVVSGAVRSGSVQKGAVNFDVVNTGNTHFSIQSVVISGKSGAGAQLFSQNITGWYVLAGGTRHFVVPISAARCAALSSLSVQVRTDAGRFGETFAGVRKQCGTTSAR